MIQRGAVLGALLVPASVWAAASEAVVSGAGKALSAPVVAAGRTAGPDFDFTALGQLLIGLLFVLLLFLGLAWLVKRAGIGAGFNEHGLKVVASLPLSTRERLVLVQAGSQQLLLGVAPGRVNLLERFDQPLVKPADKSTPPFSHWFQGALKKQQALTKQNAIDAENKDA